MATRRQPPTGINDPQVQRHGKRTDMNHPLFAHILRHIRLKAIKTAKQKSSTSRSISV